MYLVFHIQILTNCDDIFSQCSLTCAAVEAETPSCIQGLGGAGEALASAGGLDDRLAGGPDYGLAGDRMGHHRAVEGVRIRGRPNGVRRAAAQHAAERHLDRP